MGGRGTERREYKGRVARRFHSGRDTREQGNTPFRGYIIGLSSDHGQDLLALLSVCITTGGQKCPRARPLTYPPNHSLSHTVFRTEKNRDKKVQNTHPDN